MGVTTNKSIKIKSLHGIVSKDVKNYEGHPYFVKKAEHAKQMLDKVGLPKTK